LYDPAVTLALVEVRQPDRKPLLVAIRTTLEVGRDCDGLLLLDPEVSRRHVQLDLREGALFVTDLGSTNGTTVNGARIEQPMRITENDVVRLGGTEIQALSSAGLGEVGAAQARTSGPRLTTVAGSGARDSGGGDAVVRGRADDTAARYTSIDAVADAVDTEEAKVVQMSGAEGTVTIVFSDIESSTEMAMQLGDTKWFSVLRHHNDIIRKSVKKYGGNEIKSQGDGFMLTFPSARSAIFAMSDVQRDLVTYAAEHPESPIRIRVGLHTGEAIVDAGGDLFGKHIILAARIANLADGGHILASSITKEIASTRGDIHFGDAREVTLKGIEGAHLVHEVDWERSGVPTS
jgi:class 3 adenylate cyclase